MSVYCQNCDHLRAENKQLQAELHTANAENEHLCNTIDATRQDMADMRAGTLEGKLREENKRLRKAMIYTKTQSYPGLAVKEGTLLNRIYKNARQALKPVQPDKESD